MHRYAPERIRNVALVGPPRIRQDDVGGGVVAHGGGDPPPWSRRGRHDDVRPRARGARPRDVAVARPRAVRVARPQDQPPRLPGRGRLHRRAPAPPCRVADLAVVVVSAVEGVEAQTEAAWQLAAELGVPRLVFVNKLDRERADFDAVLGRAARPLRERASPCSSCRSGARPTSTASSTSSPRPPTSTTAARPRHGAPVPDELAERRAPRPRRGRRGDRGRRRRAARALPRRRRARRCPSSSTPSPSRWSTRSSSRCCAARRSPTSASTGSPTTSSRSARRPSTVPPPSWPATPRSRSPCDPDGDPLAVVFHTISDPYVGHLSLFRVLSGTIRPDDHLTNTRTGGDERLHGLFTLRGKEHVDVPEVGRRRPRRRRQAERHPHRRRARPEGQAGARGAARRCPPAVAAVALAAPHAVRRRQARPGARPAVRGGPDAASSSGPPTGQLLLRGVGDVQLAVALDRLQRRFGVGVDTEPLRVAYRETITGTAEAEGRHKKQTGGHGQFAVCVLRVEPLEQGAGFEFADKIVGGAISKGYIPAVQKGVEEAMAEGGAARLPRRRRARHPARRQGALGRLLGAGLQAGGPAGFRDAARRTPRRSCSSRCRWSRSTCPSDLARRRARRPQQPTRPGRRARRRRLRVARSSPPSCPTPSSSATPPSCARSPAAAAASRSSTHHDEVVPQPTSSTGSSGAAMAGAGR